MTHEELGLVLAALAWHSKVLAYLTSAIAVFMLIGFFWIGRELKQVAQLTAEVLRRTPAPEGE
jgi:hypothetical protein